MKRKRPTHKQRITRKNFDPLGTMMLLQGTGADKALLGKRGLRQLTYAPPSQHKHKRKNPIDTATGQEVSLGHVEFTDFGSIERYVRNGFVYRAFVSTPVFEDGYRMGVPEGSVEDFTRENPTNKEWSMDGVTYTIEPAVNGYAQNVGYQISFTGAPGYYDGYKKNYVGGDLTTFATEKEAKKAAIRFHRGLKGIKRNPASESDRVYEEFHGAPPQHTLEIHETEHVHGNLAGLGDLVCLIIRLSGGKHAGQRKQLNAPDPGRAKESDIVHVASNEAKNQIYFVGGDQSVDVKVLGFRDSFDINHDGETFEATELKDLMVLGEVCKLTYRTQKAFDKFEDVDYFHRVGEDTKVRPFLLYDTMNARMRLAGGEYTVHEQGIVN